MLNNKYPTIKLFRSDFPPALNNHKAIIVNCARCDYYVAGNDKIPLVVNSNGVCQRCKDVELAEWQAAYDAEQVRRGIENAKRDARLYRS